MLVWKNTSTLDGYDKGITFTEPGTYKISLNNIDFSLYVNNSIEELYYKKENSIKYNIENNSLLTQLL